MVLIPLLIYFSASHSSQAVSPPPDGDYPGGNTADDQNALLSLTAGTYNTAVGWFSLQSNLTGGFNMANGTTASLQHHRLRQRGHGFSSKPAPQMVANK